MKEAQKLWVINILIIDLRVSLWPKLSWFCWRGPGEKSPLVSQGCRSSERKSRCPDNHTVLLLLYQPDGSEVTYSFNVTWRPQIHSDAVPVCPGSFIYGSILYIYIHHLLIINFIIHQKNNLIIIIQKQDQKYFIYPKRNSVGNKVRIMVQLCNNYTKIVNIEMKETGHVHDQKRPPKLTVLWEPSAQCKMQNEQFKIGIRSMTSWL